MKYYIYNIYNIYNISNICNICNIFVPMNKKHNKSYRSLKNMRQHISKTKRIQHSNKNKKRTLTNGRNNKTKFVEKRRRLRHIVQRGGLPPGWTEHTDPDSGRIYYFNTSTGQSAWEYPVVDPVGFYKGSPPGPLDTYTYQPDTHIAAAAAGGGDAYSANNSKKYSWVRETQPVKGQNFAAGGGTDLLGPYYDKILEPKFASKYHGTFDVGDFGFDLRDPENMTMTDTKSNKVNKIKRQLRN